MAKKETYRQKSRWLAKVVAIAAVALLIIVSVREKNGIHTGFKLPYSEFIDSLFADHIPVASNVQNVPLENAGVKTHFIDVGQGKSILIQTAEQNVLIDAGENNMGLRVLKYLNTHGVSSLDLVIGTHPHSDHIGGLDDVITGMPVKKVILPVIADEFVPTTSTYTDLLEDILKAGLKITPAKPGDVYDLGGGAALTILGPIKDSSDLNDMSVVSRLDYGSISFLFTGDATKFEERDMLESGEKLRADVLDVGHHGSSTSTSAEFLNAVRPSVSVVSCEIDNKHGHPHRQVVERLMERNIKLLRTDLDGSIIISSDGEALAAQTEK